MGKQVRTTQTPVNRIVINDWYAITKMRTGCFILSDVIEDKETGREFYPTIAIYSDELKLAADIINLSVKRGVFLKTITSFSDLSRQGAYIAGLCRNAIDELNKREGR
ncbi:DUF5405 family protein [Serratia fonticola]|uniref:DUF5405 family protein n=1 Tax=Serratia fonticola TaxID=47917 RepID=A0AAW3WQJ8_SERFO|nr:DUF5405 family protein [Serratia fonticola]MBC3211902.1 DUF5405 family protein [Serratia fonticola]NYA13463.1 DUF5405 family protein [Serratia fonticola]NYA33273.1 DUF5405 family protein [Serratia fonticola]